jgi:hypothetical protein
LVGWLAKHQPSGNGGLVIVQCLFGKSFWTSQILVESSALLAVFKNSRSAHRAIVPIAVVPLLLTAVTGILYSLLEAREIEADWLMALHIGKFGPLDLEPFYSVILGVCVLVLSGSGLSLWFKTRRRAS